MARTHDENGIKLVDGKAPLAERLQYDIWIEPERGAVHLELNGVETLFDIKNARGLGRRHD